MPELPEIEHLRRSLEPVLIGGRVSRVRLLRSDIVRDAARGRSRVATDSHIDSAALLSGATITGLQRHGKQLAIISDLGPALGIHLGMTGQLRYLSDDETLEPSDHVHCRWSIMRNGDHGALVFRDPRRFGGLWTAENLAQLQRSCWRTLGPDALATTADDLHAALKGTRRAIKAALLDQTVIAGLGNIYVDEALHLAAIDPRSKAHRLSRPAVNRLHHAINKVLLAAIAGGGSTMRDYVDGNGVAGTYTTRHRVYGRGGAPCPRCGFTLMRIKVSQRGTTFCQSCQKRSP